MRPRLVDIHCHILPGLDDGAADIADAVAMARQAAADGIGVVCATPHIRHDHDVPIADLEARVTRLGRALAEHEVPVEIVQAGEVAAAMLDSLDEAELRLVSIGGTGRWVLLEPSPGPLSDALIAAVDRLAQRGIRAVIAHPERHLGRDYHKQLAALTDRGALIQVTAALVLESATGPTLVDLAARGLAHLVASDAHSARVGRPVAIRDAIDLLEREVGPELAAFAREAPAALLRGEDVEPPQPAAAPMPS
jgi:protein-tyrosine phosphatase